MTIKEWYPDSDMKVIYKIQAYTGYEAYAVTYWDEKTGAIAVVEETPDGQVLGSYVGRKMPKGDG